MVELSKEEKLLIKAMWDSGRYYVKEIAEQFYIGTERVYRVVKEFENEKTI